MHAVVPSWRRYAMPRLFCYLVTGRMTVMVRRNVKQSIKSTCSHVAYFRSRLACSQPKVRDSKPMSKLPTPAFRAETIHHGRNQLAALRVDWFTTPRCSTLGYAQFYFDFRLARYCRPRSLRFNALSSFFVRQLEGQGTRVACDCCQKWLR